MERRNVITVVSDEKEKGKLPKSKRLTAHMSVSGNFIFFLFGFLFGPQFGFGFFSKSLRENPIVN